MASRPNWSEIGSVSSMDNDGLVGKDMDNVAGRVQRLALTRAKSEGEPVDPNQQVDETTTARPMSRQDLCHEIRQLAAGRKLTPFEVLSLLRKLIDAHADPEEGNSIAEEASNNDGKDENST